MFTLPTPNGTYIFGVFTKIRPAGALVDPLRQDIVVDGKLDHFHNLVELGVRVEMIARQMDELRVVHVVIGQLAVTRRQQGLILAVGGALFRVFVVQ